MFRLTTPTSSYSPFCADCHTPYAGGRAGTHGNGVLAGLPAYLIQSVLNAAARLIYRLRSRDHITDALIRLHWLRVPERIQYKLAVLMYKVLHLISVHSSASLIYLVDERYVLLAPIVLLCHRSN